MNFTFLYPVFLNFSIISASYYNPVAAQTNSDPTMTASGMRIDTNDVQQWCALSRDLIYCEYRQTLTSDTTIWRGPYRFGDTLTLLTMQGVERWVVRDVLNKRYRNKIDFLQPIGKAKHGKWALILEG
jgi:hypothetical protein